MAAIITNKLRIFNAQQFLESLAEEAALWQQNYAYVEGDVVLNNTNLYVCVESGTSDSSGTGPNVATGTQNDGTVRWAFIMSLYTTIYIWVLVNIPLGQTMQIHQHQ